MPFNVVKILENKGNYKPSTLWKDIESKSNCALKFQMQLEIPESRKHVVFFTDRDNKIIIMNKYYS